MAFLDCIDRALAKKKITGKNADEVRDRFKKFYDSEIAAGNADALDEWNRLVPLLPAGLAAVDRGVLTALCTAWGRWMQAECRLAMVCAKDPVFEGLLIKTSKGTLIQNPLIGLSNKAMADYCRLSAECGMTPASRARLSAVEPPDEDPAEEYFR